MLREQRFGHYVKILLQSQLLTDPTPRPIVPAILPRPPNAPDASSSCVSGGGPGGDPKPPKKDDDEEEKKKCERHEKAQKDLDYAKDKNDLDCKHGRGCDSESGGKCEQHEKLNQDLDYAKERNNLDCKYGKECDPVSARGSSSENSNQTSYNAANNTNNNDTWFDTKTGKYTSGLATAYALKEPVEYVVNKTKEGIDFVIDKAKDLLSGKDSNVELDDINRSEP